MRASKTILDLCSYYDSTLERPEETSRHFETSGSPSAIRNEPNGPRSFAFQTIPQFRDANAYKLRSLPIHVTALKASWDHANGEINFPMRKKEREYWNRDQ